MTISLHPNWDVHMVLEGSGKPPNIEPMHIFGHLLEPSGLRPPNKRASQAKGAPARTLTWDSGCFVIFNKTLQVKTALPPPPYPRQASQYHINVAARFCYFWHAKPLLKTVRLPPPNPYGKKMQRLLTILQQMRTPSLLWKPERKKKEEEKRNLGTLQPGKEILVVSYRCQTGRCPVTTALPLALLTLRGGAKIIAWD